MATFGAVVLTVKRWFAKGEPFSISRIYELTGYARSSVETVVHRLEREGYLVKIPRQEKVGIGRPQNYYQLTSEHKKRQEFLETLLTFESELPASVVPTGVHYPLLVEEINELAKDPDVEISSKQVDEILDYLWDVYLEEGGEEICDGVKMHLKLQEVRLKWLGDRISSGEAIEELKKLQAHFYKLDLGQKVREIEEFQRIMEARVNYRNHLKNQPNEWIIHLLDSFRGYPNENFTLLEQVALTACKRQLEEVNSYANEPYRHRSFITPNLINFRNKQSALLVRQDDDTGLLPMLYIAEFVGLTDDSSNAVTTLNLSRLSESEDPTHSFTSIKKSKPQREHGFFDNLWNDCRSLVLNTRDR